MAALVVSWMAMKVMLWLISMFSYEDSEPRQGANKKSVSLWTTCSETACWITGHKEDTWSWLTEVVSVAAAIGWGTATCIGGRESLYVVAGTLLMRMILLLGGEGRRKWYQYWTWIAAVDEAAARYKAMTVQFKCSDGKIRDFLLDTGASASLVPMAMFRRVASSLGLKPSKLRLRTASGSCMQASGTGAISLWLPGENLNNPARIIHDFEVMEAGGMPAKLQIMGVDFWDKLDPVILWRERQVQCTFQNKTFTVPFQIQKVGYQTPTAAMACELEEDGTRRVAARLSQDLHLMARQRDLVDLVVQDACLEGISTLPAYQKGMQLHFGSKTFSLVWDGVTKIEKNTRGEVIIKGCMVQNLLKDNDEAIHLAAGTAVAYITVYPDMTALLEQEEFSSGEHGQTVEAVKLADCNGLNEEEEEEEMWCAALEQVKGNLDIDNSVS
jgi:hypothetical protein